MSERKYFLNDNHLSIGKMNTTIALSPFLSLSPISLRMRLTSKQTNECSHSWRASSLRLPTYQQTTLLLLSQIPPSELNDWHLLNQTTVRLNGRRGSVQPTHLSRCGHLTRFSKKTAQVARQWTADRYNNSPFKTKYCSQSQYMIPEPINTLKIKRVPWVCE